MKAKRKKAVIMMIKNNHYKTLQQIAPTMDNRKQAHSMTTYMWVVTPARGNMDRKNAMIIEAFKENQEEGK